MARMNKIQRRVRREANRLLAKRRYRENKGGMPMPFYSVRVGPAAPSEKAAARAIARSQKEGSGIVVPKRKDVKRILKEGK